MTPITKTPADLEQATKAASETSRREFLKTSGFLVVGFSAMAVAPGGPLAEVMLGAAQGAGPYPDIDFLQLDSWIAIRQDNTATFYVGKTDLGQGTGTAFRLIRAAVIDIAYARTLWVMGTTHVRY
jgi:hypothetical protein